MTDDRADRDGTSAAARSPVPGMGERVRPRRFYAAAGVAPTEGGFRVELDGRPLRTPGRRALVVPSRALADEVAREWQGQGETIDPLTMPQTRLVNVAIDGVADAIEATRGEVVRYAGSDLLCYRADSPQRLVERQKALWDPILAWAEAALDLRFRVTTGVTFIEQPAQTLARVPDLLPADPLRLSAMSVLTSVGGSVVLALAVLHRHAEAGDAWRAACVDEEVQEEIWGIDREALQVRRNRERDYVAAAELLRLCEQP